MFEDPPTDEFGKVDLLGGLADIQDRAENDGYSNQVDFDTDIRDLVNSANDGHLGLSLCSDSIFSFIADSELVSVANSSTGIPEVYVYGRHISIDVTTDLAY